MNLFGVYEGTADAKGRIMLPLAFKKQLEKVLSQGFIIKRSIYSKSLELYPMSTWSNRTKALKTLNPWRTRIIFLCGFTFKPVIVL